MNFRVALSALFALSILSAPAMAQTPTPAPVEGGAVWYGQQLVSLSEVLGGAHYLRILCQGRSDQHWRDYMRGVIQREPQYNAQLVEGFNRGYRDQEARYPTCDLTATQMEAELRAQGVRIANALRARHSQ